MAGVIPDETVREVLQRVDLVQLIGESVRLRKVGARFVGLCPFHSEKTPSFSVNGEQGFYYCFGCQAGGDAISFLRDQQGLSFREAVEQLAARAGVQLPEDEEVTPGLVRARARARDERARVLEANALAQSFFRTTYRGSSGEEARAYVEQRGIEPEVVDRFGLGAAPRSWDALTLYLRRNEVSQETVERSGLVAHRSSGAGFYDRFRGRLTFPVLDISGKVLGFSARLLGADEEGPKYINTPETPVFTKGEHFYGLYQARRAMRASRRAVLVEGNVDVVMLSQAGVENVVAPMGTAITDAHVHVLKRFVDDVDVVFDGDRAGRAAATKALELLLAEGLGGRLVLLPEGEDPDSLVRSRGADAFDKLLRESPALSEFYLSEALDLYDGSVPSKTKVIEAAQPLFGWLTSPVERDDYERRVEQRLELSPGALKRYLGDPEATSRLSIPAEMLQSKRLRVVSRVELDLLELILCYPHLLARFVEDGGIELIRGEKRRWLAERCLAHFDEWRGTLVDAAGFVMEIEDPKIRSFVARALNEEPRIAEDDSERAYEDDIAALKDRDLKERSRRVSAGLPTTVSGELSDDILSALREKERLRDGGAMAVEEPSESTPDTEGA